MKHLLILLLCVLAFGCSKKHPTEVIPANKVGGTPSCTYTSDWTVFPGCGIGNIADNKPSYPSAASSTPFVIHNNTKILFTPYAFCSAWDGGMHERPLGYFRFSSGWQSLVPSTPLNNIVWVSFKIPLVCTEKIYIGETVSSTRLTAVRVFNFTMSSDSAGTTVTCGELWIEK